MYARFVSETTATLNGRVLFALTEDSIYYSAPNGDVWHNHVLRDYYPDHIGTAVELRYQDSVTVSYPFTINSGWVANRCEIVAMIQNPNLVGQTKEIWQGAKILIPELPLTAVEEVRSITKNSPSIKTSPNPCINHVRFAFSMEPGSNYQITFSDITGRIIKQIGGVTRINDNTVDCNLKNSVAPGVYFYRFESEQINATGKIIVK